MASSNTIGVFLDTIKSVPGAGSKGRSELLTDLISALEKRGGKETVGALAKELGLSTPDYMEAVFLGRERELLVLKEQNGEQIVELTKLGSAFSTMS